MRPSSMNELRRMDAWGSGALSTQTKRETDTMSWLGEPPIPRVPSTTSMLPYLACLLKLAGHPGHHAHGRNERQT